MITTVGSDKISLKRNLTEIFPKEFSNRLLINEFIHYILNNFFEKSQEKLISAYVGDITKTATGIGCYLNEPSTERQLHQLIPTVKVGDSSEDIMTYSNFISGLYRDGCKISNQNQLLASKYWSWCPPINADMFINFNNYYWVPQDKDEFTNLKILTSSINVKDSIIGKDSYTYKGKDEYNKTITYTFKQGDKVVFTNDTSKEFGTIPYNIVSVKPIILRPTKTPLIVLSDKTNISSDIIGKEKYIYNDKNKHITFNFINGMRVYFLNDITKELNHIPYIVTGVGKNIQLIDDTYSSLNGEFNKDLNYISMDRGCKDGNQWSKTNRWVHRTALEEFNMSSITEDYSGNNQTLHHASMPIICFNKDIELYNSGSFDRGYAIVKADLKPTDITNKPLNEVANLLNLKENEIKNNDKILLTKLEGGNKRHLYTITIMGNNSVILQPALNGQMIDGKPTDGTTVKGDAVTILNGINKGNYYYYDGLEWIKGQTKEQSNSNVLFNLYDYNKIALDNPVDYPNSTFKGSKIFDYKESDDKFAILNENIKKALDKADSNENYYFVNHIEKDVYYYQPNNDYQKEIIGYKFFKSTEDGEKYLNDWHLSNIEDSQYIRTRVSIKNEIEIVDKEFEFKLDYLPSKTSFKESLIIYKNGKYLPKAKEILDGDKTIILKTEESYSIKDKTITMYQSNVGDIFDIKLLTDDNIKELSSDYTYEYPLSLTVNQLNKSFGVIAYNNCFDQMNDIIQKQVGLVGSSNGSNNYSSLNPDLSVGTKIVQHSSPIIKSIILNNLSNVSVRDSITYSMSSYIDFKNKFINVLNEMYIDGEIVEEDRDFYETAPYELDEKIKNIITKINIGKEGLQPFYNNGVLHLIENAYIPATPAYLGLANCYEPHIEEYSLYPSNNKPMVLVGHDGSYTRLTETVKDLVLFRLENLIYESIQTKFKSTKTGLNFYPYIAGKFRENTYTRDDYIKTYSENLESWAIKNSLDYSENIYFNYSTEDKEAWKTWNYTGLSDIDGEVLKGSYRSIYMYYYDTYRPNTHPWEMLGFGDKPLWWDSKYGSAPYTSEHRLMWSDIENGIIAEGNYKGQYKEFERKGLYEKYLPVDSRGNLKSPMEIGIIKDIPSIQTAKARWKIGDLGDVEVAYTHTSEYCFAKELTHYLLKPIEWVEQGWDTVDKEVLFKGTSYEQTVDSKTKEREDISKTIIHNELVDNTYVRKYGLQQWITDYLLHNNINVTDYLGTRIRQAKTSLGYRCSGFYQKGTVDIVTDSYGSIPEENVHMNLYKSYNNKIFTYSGLIVEKSKKGFIIDGFDKVYPYFTVLSPEASGSKSVIEESGIRVNYYKNWKEKEKQIAYRSEFNTIQEVYDIIIGYGKYLEKEGWFFETRSSTGELTTFNNSALTFIKWATVQNSEEAIGNIVLLNPGVIGLGIYTSGMVDDINNKITGQCSVLDIYGNPIKAESMNVFRKSFNTYITPKDNNIGLVKLRTFNLEHLITLDNKTVFEDVLYEPIYSNILSRIKISGVKVKNWYGDIYAPGYLLEDDGATPNYDKKANDLHYMFDVDDVHCQGEYGDYSRGIAGYNETKTYKELFRNNKSMFDFYKGAIAQKGTSKVLNKMNRSSYISSTGNNIDLYELWAFKAGELGHTQKNSVIEFLLEPQKLKQSPQLITFEAINDYYFKEGEDYKKNAIVIYDNYEYICLGSKKEEGNKPVYFDDYNWKKLRFVGNYIIFKNVKNDKNDKNYKNNKNWLSAPLDDHIQTFKYTNEFLTNPTGGSPMVEDCEYIVANEEELNRRIDEFDIGNTIWVVKTANGDWDVLKKTGKNKLVSMRYETIKDALDKPDYEYVYHITDNGNDYYTTVNSDEIVTKRDTPLYNDIDCNESTVKWYDLKQPLLNNNFDGTHRVGYNHKIKVFNTLFSTTVPEENIEGSTPVSVSDRYDTENTEFKQYSDLLLTMLKPTSTKKKIYKFNINIDTQIDRDKVVTYVNGSRFIGTTITIPCEEGTVINYLCTAPNCESKGEDNVEIKDGTKLTRNVKLRYKKGTVLFETNKPSSNLSTQILTPKKDIDKKTWVYDIVLVGAGGGAGGGTYKSDHKHPGSNGGTGAYLHAKLNLTTTSPQTPYTITTGAGGAGGSNGHTAAPDGISGGDSYITSSDGKTTLIAYGGGAGQGARTPAGRRDKNGKLLNIGGTYYPKKNQVKNINIESDSSYGNNAPNYKSVYLGTNYGEAGQGVYKYAGLPGKDGYAKITYIDGDESSITEVDEGEVTIETIKPSNNKSYFIYHQKYVQNEYFYSYDTLTNENEYEGKRLVEEGSSFYKNRCRAITGKHQTSVIKNQWTSNTTYNIGDTVTDKQKYYICVESHVSAADFDTSKWEEYFPTYYYKIERNADINYNNIDKDDKDKLYEDSKCLNPVYAEVENKTKQLQVEDLQNPKIGDKIYLVDKFATYLQIKPTYISEPLWSDITSTGTFSVTSGFKDYYVDKSKEKIKGADILYKDAQCKEIVTNYEGTPLTYSNITDTLSEIREPTYQFTEDEIVLYADGSNRNHDMKVYDDVELTVEKGLFGDYIPTYETITYIPNMYAITNIINNPSIYYVDKIYSDATLKQDTNNEGATDVKTQNITLYSNSQLFGKRIQLGSVLISLKEKEGEEEKEKKEAVLRYVHAKDESGKFITDNGKYKYVEIDKDEEGNPIYEIETKSMAMYDYYIGELNNIRYKRLYKDDKNEFYELYNYTVGDEKFVIPMYIEVENPSPEQGKYRPVKEEDLITFKKIVKPKSSEEDPNPKDPNPERKNEDKIVNEICYKEKGDMIYITNDEYYLRNENLKSQDRLNVNDSNNISLIDGTMSKEGQKGWIKLEYIDNDSIFDTLTIERQRVNANIIDSCNLVNNETDETIVKVQSYDPIRNIIPNNVLDEVNYITSIDPVNDYEDSGKWSDSKIGYLWWDTSKVRYLDYYQGDYEYKRLNWGKQLPGSEIAIMEWSKNITPPESEETPFVTQTVYNDSTETTDTYYYYWVKNPTNVPDVSFRKNSAFVISSIINNPTKEGIVWMSPIDGNIYGKNENSFIISNYNNVLLGQNAVLQLNINPQSDVLSHSEWATVKENSSSDIPDYLWDKMKDSLLGQRTLDDADKTVKTVPTEGLTGKQRLGLSVRPYQTMFDKIFVARENFIDIVNDIFGNRSSDNLGKDTTSSLVKEIDMPDTTDYYSITETKLEMMSWKDEGLIGKHILVKHDESHNNMWVIYEIKSLIKGEEGYEVVDYQKYNIEKYLSYKDWYMDDDIQYIMPTYTVTSTLEAQNKIKNLPVGSIVRVEDRDMWELWQQREVEGLINPTLVGKSKALLQISKKLCSDNKMYDNKLPYINNLTRKQYEDNEVLIILQKLLEYFEK